MLSVIIDARGAPDGLPILLAQLTAGAVDGLVRQVLIVAAPGQPAIDHLCEDMGAEEHPTLESAGAVARSDQLLILPAGFRLRDGWIKTIESHLVRGAGPAVVTGFSEAGLFGRRPFGVLVERSRLEGRRGADLQRLRRDLGLRAGRVG
ncbi:MAG TPA: cell wall biosynthesis glycosyltransferase [Phenylobacterium sp.]